MNDFEYINKPLNQFLTCYFMVDHPGCSLNDTKELLNFINKNLKFKPEQVQVFTPTPSTYSTLMYYTEQDLNGNDIFVEKDRNARMKQKLTITQGTNNPYRVNNNKYKKYGSYKRKYRKQKVGRW
jgi:radical SAM superfamily enzyme YgiQ (UPF0313 family)